MQGVKEQSDYILTDPAIISLREGQYGMTDMGPQGIVQFFDQHRCNKFCKAMNLKEYNFGQSKARIVKETSYTFGIR